MIIKEATYSAKTKKEIIVEREQTTEELKYIESETIRQAEEQLHNEFLKEKEDKEFKEWKQNKKK